STVSADYMPGITASDQCSIHRSSGDDPLKSAEVWPGEISRFLDKSGMLSAGSLKAAANKETTCAIRINSPVNRESFLIMDDMSQLKQAVGLSAVARKSAGALYWFVDNELFSIARDGQTVFWPLRRGQHLIACSASGCESDRVSITVE
ncbi:MAG: hypothetical protein WCN95_08965, partial [bacterium]